MTKIPFKTSRRFNKRQFASAFNKRLEKMLVEAITNSDDNYRRIEEDKDINKQFFIKIFLDNRTKTVAILDEGTGMTEKELNYKFGTLEYGDKKSDVYKGVDTRGMFGQGISDVLFNNDLGFIGSVTNDGAASCYFLKEDGYPTGYDINEDKNIKKMIQNLFETDIKTGTLIHFRLNAPMPKYENIVNKLINEPMLRLINENKNRRIELTYKDLRGKKKQAVIEYQAPNSKEVFSKEFDLTYEKYKIKASLKLWEAEEIIEPSIKGILIYDKGGSVLEQNTFGFEHHKAFDRVFGRLELNGIKRLMLDKFESDNVLTDTRDGFSTSHPFYSYLKEEISTILKQFMNDNQGAKQEHIMTGADRKVLEVINKYYEDILEDNSGGTIPGYTDSVKNGIEFDRSYIHIKKDAEYRIALKIDRDKILKDEIIKLECDNKNIVFSPKDIHLRDIESDKSIVRKSIKIRGNAVGEGLLKATVGNFSTSLVIDCTSRRYIYPENGLKFEPDKIGSKPKVDKEAELYIDLNKIKRGRYINLIVSDEKIKLREDSITVPGPLDRKEKTVAKEKIVFSGEDYVDSATVTAKYGEYNAELEVSIRDSVPKKNKGLFKGWRFEELGDTFNQPWRYGDDGFISIHKKHPINMFYFGTDPDDDLLKTDVRAQLYLSELITDAAVVSQLSKVVDKKIVDDDPASIMFYVYETKRKLGKTIYGLYVNKRLLSTQLEMRRKRSPGNNKSYRKSASSPLSHNSHPKPIAFKLNGERIEVRNWKDIWFETCDRLCEYEYNFVEEMKKIRRSKAPYLSYNEEDLMHPKKLKNCNVFIETNFSRLNIIQQSQEILAHFGYDTDLKIETTN